VTVQICLTDMAVLWYCFSDVQATTLELAEGSNESAQTVNRALLHLRLVHQVSASGKSRPLLFQDSTGDYGS